MILLNILLIFLLGIVYFKMFAIEMSFIMDFSILSKEKKTKMSKN